MALRNLLPLVVLLMVVGILAFVGYVAYNIAQDVSKRTRENMEKKNFMFTREGMKVGVKEVNDEDYKDRSQSVLVNMWNHTSFPAYKSRLWKTTGPDDTQNSAAKRKPYSN